ncbi:MAG: hypothetical protein HY879_10310 [Deltaproteobacteria bacterium]|nr:hypothetical protein [Deltaproteobacteria bacterium]
MMKRKKLKKYGWAWGLVSGLLVVLMNSTMVSAGIGMHYAAVTVSEKDQIKILSFLERKIGDQQLMEKAREKLLSLDEKQTRLIVSLSERISEDRTARADVAYLIIAALIALS